MNEVDEFLGEVLPRFDEAETALHNGDPQLRIAMWSHEEPVTLFGAVRSAYGWTELRLYVVAAIATIVSVDLTKILIGE